MRRLKFLLAALVAGAALGQCPTNYTYATVSNQTVETITANGNGVTTNYVIGFDFRDNTQVAVTEVDTSTTPATYTTIPQGAGAGKFTVTGGNPGTTVVMGTAPSTTQHLVITRSIPLTQTISYDPAAAFPASSHERQMDYFTLLLQNQNFSLNQKIGLSPYTSASTPTFPDPVIDGIVAWNHTGSNLTLLPSPSTAGQINYFTGSAWAAGNIDNILPSEGGNSGKFLTTNGTNSSWATVPGGTVTSVGLTVPSFLSVSGSPVVGSGTLALSLSGTALPVANGGTGQTTKTAAFDGLSPNATKGDITVFNGTNNVSLGVGSDGQVLTADSAQTKGVKWATSAALTNPMTTAGDVIKGGVAGAPARLAIGANHTVLHSDGTDATWQALVGADLPNPSSSTLGGVQSAAAVSHQWINSISTSGVPALSQPACGDLSNAVASCSTDTTNAANISSGTLAIARGGTNVSSVTTAPTATAFAGWDTNSNLSANAFIPGYATTATAAGTTTLTVSSAQEQYFTGSTTQTVKLPVTSTLVTGQKFKIVNLSSGAVTVQSSGSNTLQAMAQNTQLVATCISTSGTGTASWDWTYQAVQNSIGGGGTVTSVTFTGDGTVLSSTPSGAVTTSGTVTATLNNASAGTYLGGPYSGSAAAPTYKAFQAPTIQKFTSTGTTTGYVFTVSGVTTAPTAGATYTNNANTYTVLSTNTGKTLIWTTQASAPQASGTLTKTAGTGDATITFSSAQALATYTKATGALYLRVRMVGGGGGGTASGTASWGTPGNGGTSYFGDNALITNGGTGVQTPASAGVGGSASINLGSGVAITGSAGQPGPWGGGAVNNIGGGTGGNSALGGAGNGGWSSSVAAGAAATNSGSGGGGAGVNTASGYPGGGGGAGGFVDAIITSPSATYVYAVGGGGTGATAGTNGFAGGNGAAGIVEVTEYYQ